MSPEHKDDKSIKLIIHLHLVSRLKGKGPHCSLHTAILRFSVAENPFNKQELNHISCSNWSRIFSSYMLCDFAYVIYLKIHSLVIQIHIPIQTLGSQLN
jgi:hypothetical protein